MDDKERLARRLPRSGRAGAAGSVVTGVRRHEMSQNDWVAMKERRSARLRRYGDLPEGLGVLLGVLSAPGPLGRFHGVSGGGANEAVIRPAFGNV